MKKNIEYILFAVIPGLIFGILGYIVGINTHQDLYCRCTLCSISIYEAGFYTALIGISIGFIFGAGTYLIWDKKMKRKSFIDLSSIFKRKI